MDEERVLARLDRIDELKRSGAAPGELLSQLQAELRGLLREAEALTREQLDATSEKEEVVGRPRTARARDIIGM
jgi:hypothetical protein